MKRFLFLAATAMLAAPAFADSELLPVSGIRHANYNVATGEITRPDGHEGRAGAICWDSTRTSGSFSGRLTSQVVLDWGDVSADCESAACFQIGYATDSSAPITVDVIFYSDENGFGSVGRVPLAAFRLAGLPGGVSGPGIYNGWLITVTPTSPIDLSNGGTAADLDADGLIDFGYSFQFRGTGDGSGGAIERHGPIIADADPNVVPFPAPGIEDAFDRFSVDPNNPPGPNDLLIPDVNVLFDGTFWFGGPPGPFAQWYLQLQAGNGVPACNQPGCETSDINGDCLVDINDLAVLLSNFGTATGATFADGDIDPAGGDGDVDITDLAIMLSDFGTNCN